MLSAAGKWLKQAVREEGGFEDSVYRTEEL